MRRGPGLLRAWLDLFLVVSCLGVLCPCPCTPLFPACAPGKPSAPHHARCFGPSRDHDASRRRRARTLLWYLRLETLLTLLIAFVITLFVVSVFAYGFFGNPAYPGGLVACAAMSAGVQLASEDAHHTH